MGFGTDQSRKGPPNPEKDRIIPKRTLSARDLSPVVPIILFRPQRAHRNVFRYKTAPTTAVWTVLKHNPEYLLVLDSVYKGYAAGPQNLNGFESQGPPGAPVEAFRWI